MKTTPILTSTAIILSIVSAPTAADAQDRARDNSHSRGAAVRSGDQRGADRAVPRDTAVPRDNGARASEEARARNDARERDNARANEQARARAESAGREQAAARASARERDDRSRGNANQNRDRSYDNRGRVYENRAGTYSNRGSYYGGRYYGAPRFHLTPRFQRVVPYRVYTPRPYGLGFSLGIFFGRPLPYQYSYPVPVYGYPTVAPGIAYGGISFGISPGDADVYIDGEYFGVAHDFNGADQPLTLAAGRHRVELQSPGYEPMVFDVDVVPGQVTPYTGGMQPRY